ncbi:hypothetical protein F5878DRAFT_702185 [Lentinula raphanica]|uniref:DUF6533 domain-containing protein n=1 Tax=Lentinula raphanica TaxID=153919 RepID=A0AA38PLV7_9AGAR|nr:hypothetical protein F5878DRAFT_702185 [Lentinula raphanica]
MAMELDLISDMIEVRDTNYVAIVGFTIMLWDHVDTFTTEVKYIWPRVGERKPIVYLFLINRYIMPLGFIINLVAYFKIDAEEDTLRPLRRRDDHDRDQRRRIDDANPDQKWVVTGVASLLIAEIGVYSWLMSTGERNGATSSKYNVMYNDIWRKVILSDNPAASSASAWIPLLHDTVIFSLTLHATIPSVRNAQGSAAIYIMKQLLKDGLIYYRLVTMMSRITLNLMQSPHKHQNRHDILILTSIPSRAPNSDQNESAGEFRRPYSLSLPPIALPPRSSRIIQTSYPSTPGKGKDRDDNNSPGQLEFDDDIGTLPFGSHPYATSTPRLD